MKLEKMMETYKRENSVTPREEKILETIQKSKNVMMEVQSENMMSYTEFFFFAVSLDSKEMVDITGNVACLGIFDYAIFEGFDLSYENIGSCFCIFCSDDYSGILEK